MLYLIEDKKGGMKLEDKDIVELFFNRSEKAITEMMDKYGRLCHGVARGVLRSEEDSEECLNTACMRIWNAIPPKRPEKLGGYFCRIVRNIAINEYHRNKKRTDNETDTELCEIIPAERTVEIEYDAQEISRLINEFLEKHKKKNRQIFVSRYYMGTSLSVIGDMLGMSESAVKSRLHRIRDGLRAYLIERGIDI